MANKSGYYKYLREQKLKESVRRQFSDKSSSKKLVTIATVTGIIAGIVTIACILLLLF
jgi:hypothetical protein